jgi:hypothetical protein
MLGLVFQDIAGPRMLGIFTLRAIAGSATPGAISQFTRALRHFPGWLFLDEEATRQFWLLCKAIVKPL